MSQTSSNTNYNCEVKLLDLWICIKSDGGFVDMLDLWNCFFKFVRRGFNLGM